MEIRQTRTVYDCINALIFSYQGFLRLTDIEHERRIGQ